MKRRRNPPIEWKKVELARLYDKWRYIFLQPIGFRGDSYPEARRMPTSEDVTFKLVTTKKFSAVTMARFERPRDLASKYRRMEVVLVGLPEIRFNKTIVYDDSKLDGIMLHEMIHLYLIVNGWPYESHGPRFRDLLDQLSRATGVDIPRNHELEKGDEVDVKERELFVVAAIIDGKPYFALLALNTDRDKMVQQLTRAAMSYRRQIDLYRFKTKAHALAPIHRTIMRTRWVPMNEVRAKYLDLLNQEPLMEFDANGWSWSGKGKQELWR